MTKSKFHQQEYCSFHTLSTSWPADLACSEPSNTRTSRLTVGQINHVEETHGNNKEESSNIILSIPFPNVPSYYVLAIEGKLKLIRFKDGFKAVLIFLRLMLFR